MNDFSVREYTSADIPALNSIWHEVFGDDESFIAGFLERLGGFGTAAVALCGERPVGAAYVITGLELVSPEAETKKCGYIYAVAVLPEYRKNGLGAELTQYAAALGRGLGAELICTLPAEQSLYAWYEKLIGTRYILHIKEAEESALAGAELREIPAQRYFELREGLLENTPHLRLSEETAEFQAFFCRYFGGGFFESESGIAMAYPMANKCYVNELLCADPDCVKSLAASAAWHFGAQKAVYRLASEQGRAFLASEAPIAPGCVWSYCFD